MPLQNLLNCLHCAILTKVPYSLKTKLVYYGLFNSEMYPIISFHIKMCLYYLITFLIHLYYLHNNNASIHTSNQFVCLFKSETLCRLGKPTGDQQSGIMARSVKQCKLNWSFFIEL